MDWSNLRKDIMDKLDFQRFYTNEQLQWASQAGDEWQATCPFHNDTQPSFSVTMSNGLWFCHGQCQEGGSPFEFLVKKHNMSFAEAAKQLAQDVGLRLEDYEEFRIDEVIIEKPPIPKELPDNFHDLLLKNETKQAEFCEKRGLSEEIIKEHKIGWDGERFTIPIYDENGIPVNIRRYKINAKKTEPKMLSWRIGKHKYGKLAIYGHETIKNHHELIFCEGELDRLILLQHGFNAFTITGGAGHWRDEWTSLLNDKIVHLCFDLDNTGERGMKKIAGKFIAAGINTYIVRLPDELGEHGDVTDFFSAGHTTDELKQLLDKALLYEPIEIEASDDKIYEVHLSESSKAFYVGKQVRVPVLVCGKDKSPYLYPKHIHASCSIAHKARCLMCPLKAHGGEMDIEIDTMSPHILQLIECSEAQQKGIIKGLIGAPRDCYQMSYTVVEQGNVEDIRVIPPLHFTLDKHEYAARRFFYAGHGIEANREYIIEGYPMPEPKYQYATVLFDQVEPAQTDIDQFEMTPDLAKKLEIFQVAEGRKIDSKFTEIYTDFEFNCIKGARQRHELFRLYDMMYHSVIAFYLQERLIENGWMQVLVLGDSGQAKTTVAQGMIQHYQLGRSISGESLTFAGLVGGLKQTDKRWYIVWGILPLSDRRALFIDEFADIPEETIASLSDVRSSGIAKLTKTETDQTWARTRLAMLSNPRDGQPLAHFNYGIEALKGVIPKIEDIRRIDLALTVASGEVPLEVINTPVWTLPSVSHVYTSELCNALVLWAWSRTPEQVVIEKVAEELILMLATDLAETYSSDIPIVEGADQRLKLARQAIAVAARVFSTDETFQKIVVKADHVGAAYDFTRYCYNKSSMGYDIYSRLRKRALTIDNRPEVIDKLKTFPGWEVLVEILLSDRFFRRSALSDTMGYDTEYMKKLMSFLLGKRLVKASSRGYTKSKAFIILLKELLEELP